MRNNSADTKISEGGGGVPRAGAEIPLQPLVQPMVSQAVPCTQGGPWGSRDPPAARGGPHARAGEECEESSPEEQAAAETTGGELTTTPSPHPPVLLVGRR